MNTNYLEKKNRNPLGDKDDKLLCRFKAWLRKKGRFAESTMKLYWMMARHFLIWLHSNGTPLEGVDDAVMREFRDHKCVCELGRGGAGRYRRKSKKYQWYFVGVVYFVQFLEDTGHTRHPGERELGMRVLEKYIQQCENQGYRKSTKEFIVVASTHFLSWLHTQRISINAVTREVIGKFLRHDCICLNRGNGKGVFSPSGYYLACLKGFVEHFAGAGTWPEPTCTASVYEDETLKEFRWWLENHRSLKSNTIKERVRIMAHLFGELGSDPKGYTAERIGRIFVKHTSGLSVGSARNVASSLKLYVRYQSTKGICRRAVVDGLPRSATKRHSSLPRYITMEEVERVISSCNPGTATGVRDRAILLLLARLGLRAGDVMNLRFKDVDWKKSIIVVTGKSGRSSRLPLPQDVGDAILRYIKEARPRVAEERIFLCKSAPFRRFETSRTVSQIAIRAMKRVGVKSPSGTGSHVFRHSLATHLLRSGASMEDVQAILRHSSMESTEIYAKVNITMLMEVAQLWIGDEK